MRGLWPAHFIWARVNGVTPMHRYEHFSSCPIALTICQPTRRLARTMPVPGPTNEQGRRSYVYFLGQAGRDRADVVAAGAMLSRLACPRMGGADHTTRKMLQTAVPETTCGSSSLPQ